MGSKSPSVRTSAAGNAEEDTDEDAYCGDRYPFGRAELGKCALNPVPRALETARSRNTALLAAENVPQAHFGSLYPASGRDAYDVKAAPLE